MTVSPKKNFLYAILYSFHTSLAPDDHMTFLGVTEIVMVRATLFAVDARQIVREHSSVGFF
tara:strand:+ start:726 stop:908 length:183 start_codon:yes stop_codon:yes gene_type:complete